MKILHITDTHATVKGPESRKDIYYISFLKKMLELEYVIKKHHIDIVIHSGDLFHTPRVSDKFAGQISEIIKSWEVPVYVVPGNHDIDGYNISTIDQTKLGLLQKTGVIQLLKRGNEQVFNIQINGHNYRIAISGQEYYPHIDEGNPNDYMMLQPLADVNILVPHSYIVPKPQPKEIRCIMTKDVKSDADIILSGHYHIQFEDYQNDIAFYNPGSTMRVDQTDYNRTHIPQYGILEIDEDADGSLCYCYNFYEYKTAQSSEEIFDYEAKVEAKSHSITLEGFKNSIGNSNFGVTANMSLLDIIDDLCETNHVSKDNKSFIEDFYKTVLSSIPDEYETQQGFIEAKEQKVLSSVELHNFESHADTIIHLVDGLNVFVGESGSGKTAILRGILWVVDNTPSGTDFIMVGKDECYVKLIYTDGSYIKRARTRTSSGTLEIGYLTEEGKFIEETYKGFANSIPVQVANVHQMPKVHITKDIETHLNVQEQLDEPFLIGQSQLAKASAIGRIAGTHLIDTAIKRCNTEILSNKKTIRIYQDDLSHLEEQKSSIKDINKLTEFANSYEKIVFCTEQIQNDIERMKTIISLYSEISDNEKKVKETIDTLKSITDRTKDIKTANILIDDINYLNNLSYSYKMISTKCDKCKSGIDSCKKILTIASDVNQAENIMKEVLLYHDLTERFHVVSDSIKELNRKKDCSERLCDNGSKISGLLLTNIEKQLMYVELYNRINNLTVNIDEITKKHNSLSIYNSTLNVTLDKIVKEREKFILNSEICPCCGQKISNCEINSIIEFMKGEP